MAPNDLRLTFDPKEIEGLKHMHMDEPSMYDSSDPKWPLIYIWPHNIGRGSQGDQPV